MRREKNQRRTSGLQCKRWRDSYTMAEVRDKRCRFEGRSAQFICLDLLTWICSLERDVSETIGNKKSQPELKEKCR